MRYQEIRERSLATASSLGFSTNPSLPLLDSDSTVRDSNAVLDRLLCLYATVAASYGMSRDAAKQWLNQEGLLSKTTASENSYLDSAPNTAKDNAMQWSVEALWTLAWVCGYHNDLDFNDSCADNFIQMLPDLNRQESAADFLSRAQIRSREEIEAMLDLAYCVHWSVREAQMQRQKTPGKIPANVVEQRRKALEWVLSNTNWDDVTLDT